MEIKEIIWFFSGLAAWVAFGLGIVNFFRVSKIEKTKLYLDLRGRYLQVRRQVPDRYLVRPDFFRHLFDSHRKISRNFLMYLLPPPFSQSLLLVVAYGLAHMSA